jgi:tryptophan synthase beta chain
VEYCSVTDAEALDAFGKLTLLEGIIPALESAHAVAEARKRAAVLPRDSVLVVCLSGRGDKDLDSVLALRAAEKRGGQA